MANHDDITLDKRILSDSALDDVVEAARAEAARRNIILSIAVVDDSGLLCRFVRMQGIHAGTVDVAIAKARSAALFRRSGKVFGDLLGGGAQFLLALPNLLPVDGGEPLLVDGHPVGAIGVSGSTPDNDGAVARAGQSSLT